MELGRIVLFLRHKNTRFGNLIAGAAELDLALKGTLQKQMGFVIPLNDVASTNTETAGISQIITEKFAVIVALQNDTTQKDKTGLISYDQVHDVRAEIFKAILGYQFEDAESVVSYVGGKLLGINAGYLWYQFDFQYDIRIQNYYDPETNTGIDGIDIDISSGTDVVVYDENGNPVIRRLTVHDFDAIYTQYKITPSADIPYTGDLPLSDPDMTQIVDLTNNPKDGSYMRGFGLGFNIDLNT